MYVEYNSINQVYFDNIYATWCIPVSSCGWTWFYLILGQLRGQFWGQIQGQFLGQLCHFGHTSIFLRLIFFGQFWGQFHGQFLGQLCHLGHTSIFLRLNSIFGQFWGQFQGQFLGQLCHLGHTSIFLRLNLILFNFWKISGTISRSILGTVSWSILGTISWSIFGTILCHLGHTSSFLRLNFFLDNFWDNFKVIFWDNFMVNFWDNFMPLGAYQCFPEVELDFVWFLEHFLLLVFSPELPEPYYCFQQIPKIIKVYDGFYKKWDIFRFTIRPLLMK